MPSNKENQPTNHTHVVFGEIQEQFVNGSEYVTIEVTLKGKDWGSQETELLKNRFPDHYGSPIEWQHILNPTRDTNGNKIYTILGRVRPEFTSSQT